MGRALGDIESGSLKFSVNGEEVSFNVDEALQRHNDFHVNTIVDMVDVVVQDLGKLTYTGANSMVEIMLNNGEEEENEGNEVVSTMIGARGHSRNSFKLDINLKIGIHNQQNHY